MWKKAKKTQKKLIVGKFEYIMLYFVSKVLVKMKQRFFVQEKDIEAFVMVVSLLRRYLLCSHHYNRTKRLSGLIIRNSDIMRRGSFRSSVFYETSSEKDRRWTPIFIHYPSS